VPIVFPAGVTPLGSVRPYPLGNGSYNGIGWGPGQQIQIVSHTGIEETPAMRTDQQDRGQAHGAWAGPDWFSPRTVQITFVVLGRDNTDLRTLLASVERAWLPDSTDRPMALYDGHRFLTARVRQRAFEHFLGGRERTSKGIVQWFARDPFYYSPTSIASIGAGAATHLANDGTLPSPVRIQMVGPLTDPTLTNAALGASLFVNGELAPGDVLLLDSDARTVTLNGSPSDISLDPSSRWWDLLPGDNPITYSSLSAGSGERAAISYASAWP